MKEIPTIYPIKIPVVADLVLSPVVIYNDEFTSINFETEDENHGRITFQNLDAIKVCRGEIIPYHDVRKTFEDFEQDIWVYKVGPSEWLVERYQYEKKHYEHSYEWGNSVEEMLTDYSHYLFSFHDQFVEVIAKGFWFEKSEESLINKPLSANHPNLRLDKDYDESFQSNDKNFHVKINEKPLDELINDANYSHQIVYELWRELNSNYFLEATVKLKKINDQIVCYLHPSFGKAFPIKNEIPTLDDVKSFLTQ